jgi:heme oxygenase
MTNAPSNASVHHLLRQATKQPHHMLDHHPLLAPLVRQDLTVVQYGNALAALHGIQRRAEAGILAFLDEHPGVFDYHSRLKVAALDRDLAALGRSPRGIAANFPVPQTVGALVGLLYVIEGSTQGGLMIARLLQSLPIAPLPIAYFSVYGQASTQKWEEFLQFAERVQSSQDREDAVATAVSGFEAIRCHLDACHLWQ